MASSMEAQTLCMRAGVSDAAPLSGSLSRSRPPSSGSEEDEADDEDSATAVPSNQVSSAGAGVRPGRRRVPDKRAERTGAGTGIVIKGGVREGSLGAQTWGSNLEKGGEEEGSDAGSTAFDDVTPGIATAEREELETKT